MCSSDLPDGKGCQVEIRGHDRSLSGEEGGLAPRSLVKRKHLVIIILLFFQLIINYLIIAVIFDEDLHAAG